MAEQAAAGDDLELDPALLVLHREAVRPDWIDYNGHMNVAYYLLAFDHATDALLDYLGLDEAYRESTGSSTFAVETHITYQQEVGEAAPLFFASQLLGYDSKRLHYIHFMYHETEGFLAATSEWLSLHIDMQRRRVTEMPDSIRARCAEVMAAQADLPLPAEAGRRVELRSR